MFFLFLMKNNVNLSILPLEGIGDRSTVHETAPPELNNYTYGTLRSLI